LLLFCLNFGVKIRRIKKNVREKIIEEIVETSG